MNNETEMFNSKCRPGEAGMMHQSESFKERQAMKRAAIVAFLGIGIAVLFYCVVLLMNNPENTSEQPATGFTKLERPKTNRVDCGVSGNTEATIPPKGQVTAIAYSIKKPSAVMDCRIVHEGDTIHRVKVIKIERGKVHFEKNGTKWTQVVGEAPESHWK